VPGVTTEQVASIHRNFRDEEALLNASAGVQNEYSGLSGAELQRAASLKLVKLNRQSLGDAAEGWRVGFFAPLNDLLKQRQMSTATDLATAWGEIARGLEE
jgi:outer membrane protein TolC